MSEYIERKKTIDRFEDLKEKADSLKDKAYLDAVMSVLENIPTADVEPVVHGKWTEIKDPYGKIEGWLCECGREVKSKDNYCPNCGKKMDLEG